VCHSRRCGGCKTAVFVRGHTRTLALCLSLPLFLSFCVAGTGAKAARPRTAACCSVLQLSCVPGSVLQCVAVVLRTRQRVAVCCSCLAYHTQTYAHTCTLSLSLSLSLPLYELQEEVQGLQDRAHTQTLTRTRIHTHTNSLSRSVYELQEKLQGLQGRAPTPTIEAAFADVYLRDNLPSHARLQARQHTATHCNTLQRAATRCNTLQHTATHCNTLQRAATHCNTLQHICAAE